MGEAENEDETDACLMQRMAQGDTDAFDRLFLRHRRAVYGFVLRLMDGEVGRAEDLTQECFLRLWSARAAYQPGDAALRTYLLTIARRLCLDDGKRRRVPLVVWEETEAAEAAIPSATAAWLVGLTQPEKALLAQEMGATLERAIRALPPEQREVFLLRDQEGLRYEEVARVVECPLGTVRSRLWSARARLRAAILQYLQEERESGDG